MKYLSTKGISAPVRFKEAVLTSMASDCGLYIPESLPHVSFESGSPLRSIAKQVLAPFVEPDMSPPELGSAIDAAFTFDSPLVKLTDDIYILELFHGPTAAFKDFGVRFMAQVVGLFSKGRPATILTATSGDTGGAVAAAFHGQQNVRAVILYPKGKVSKVQETQIAGFGDNITALEVEGNFDDCQRMVKAAFADRGLCEKHNLLSANSINIARLLPQICYYFRAQAQLPEGSKVTFLVPSGNFGNLTAGLYAKAMGLPAAHFVAATNANDVVPRYLASGNYEPGAFVETLTNAMDIASPSNFVRIEALYGFDLERLRKDVAAKSFTDEQTLNGMRQMYERYGYVADPHTAVAFMSGVDVDGPKVAVSTAHPAKFIDTIELAIGPSPQLERSLTRKDLHKRHISADSKLADYI